MLATSSDILQIWNTNDYALISEFGHDHQPANDQIRSLDWKKDNCNYLVFTYKQTGRVQLYDIQKNKSVELSTTKAQWCSFSSSGKYLSVTNEDCQCQVWDVNSGRIAQTFSSVDQSAMECLCWGNADSYIAAGTKKGNVFLYNQLTKQSFAAFTQKQTSKSSPITSIKWSPHKDIIGTTSTDGLLSLWNSRLKELLVSIHCHKAPATDLAFSPHHDAFLITSGMDGSISCFDLVQQKILSTISIYAPLTSIDFHPNGSLIAVGTMGQNASVYDLRDPKQKLSHLVHADHPNVYSVRFDHPQTTFSSSSSSSSSSTLPRPTTLAATPETSKGLSTFAQQTIRSRHPSSSSSTSTPSIDPIHRQSTTKEKDHPRKESRERSFSSLSSTTIKSSQSTLPSTDLPPPPPSSNESLSELPLKRRPMNDSSMSFEEFAQLCGIHPHRTPSVDDQRRVESTMEKKRDVDLRLQEMLDERINALREDFQDDLNKTKLSMQMNFIVQLEKLRNDLIKEIETHSLNNQLIDEIERLRNENKRLRQYQPNI